MMSQSIYRMTVCYINASSLVPCIQLKILEPAEMPVSVTQKRTLSPASVFRHTKKRRAQHVKASNLPASPRLGKLLKTY